MAYSSPTSCSDIINRTASPTATGVASPSPQTSSQPDDERARISRTSLLLWHARQDDPSALRTLLQVDPSLVSAHGYDGRTPLHVCAFYNCLQAAAFLLICGAPVNAVDRWGNSPLADAQTKGHQKMEQLLREHGGQLLGSHGTRLGTDAVSPPIPQNCDWEVDPLELDFTKGTIIGKGSFGEIWKVWWRGTPVAVKKILPSLAEDDLIIKDFKHEVDILVKLRHPNVVQFLGAVSSKPLMLVTEFLVAGDLRTYLKENGPLPAVTAINFAKDISRGMIYLHNGSNCIIHRDLKPRNLLMLENNHVKVADFGLSKIFKTKSHQAYILSGETGSYRYMAPEVFEHKAYDTKVDVFSFAMILYEMFEGDPPLSAMDAYDAAKSMARKGTRPRLRAKTYPPHMKELIQKCWSGNYEERPSFEVVLKRLEYIERGLQQPSDNHFWRFS